MSKEFIPFTKPYLTGKEIDLVNEAISTLSLVGDGRYTQEAEQIISSLSGNVEALLTPSCTDALDMSALLLNLEPDDEVIIPGFTFTSTATAFASQKATVVFADIEPSTLNIDPVSVEKHITSKTKAIVVVNYAGIACDFDQLLELATQHNLVLIEDNAHGFGGKFKEQALGSIGHMGTLSFHATKNIQCGEGGALLTRVDDYATRAHILREKGTNRKAFLDGAVDKYTWVDLGSSFLTADYVAAFLKAQLESFDDIQSKRSAVWETYNQELKSWAKQVGASLPTIPEYASHTSHLFWITLNQAAHRPDFMAHLKDADIGSTFHYQSLAQTPAGQRYGRTLGTPVADFTSDAIVRLPLYADMTAQDTARVIDAVLGWKP